MIKRARLMWAFEKLEMKSLSIPIFQHLVRLPSHGYAIRVRLRSGSSLDSFRRKLPELAIALKADSIALLKVAPNLVEIRVHRGENISLPSYPPIEDTRYTSSLDGVPLGVDRNGYPTTLELWNESGGTLTLIGGNPGQGKSSALRIAVLGACQTNASIFWIDPKGGADARPFDSRVTVLGDPSNFDEIHRLILELRSLVTERNRLRGYGMDITALSPVLLVIDEWSLLGIAETKDRKTRLEVDLRALAATARSAKVSIILATQRPTQQNIDVATRELANVRIAFQVGDDHASISILGSKGAEDKEDPLKPGTALVWMNGEMKKVNVYRVPPDLGSLSCVATHNRLTAADLMTQLRIFEYEHEKYDEIRSSQNPPEDADNEISARAPALET